jgi:exopolysaccharide production protein ExoY
VRRAEAQAVYENSLVTLEEDATASESIYAPDFPLPTAALVESWRYRYVKRAFDIFCSLVLMIVLAIPGLLIAAAILLTSPGPVFYREQRIGRDGRRFRIWKFRSMYWHAPWLGRLAGARHGGTVLEWRMHKHLRDPRVTAVGGFLRRWSLDEIPQLVNVLRGEMSLIGPRPIVAAETALYGDLLPFYLAATPGLSGLWQVSGRSNVGYDRRAQLDAAYVRSWSLRADIAILLRTLPAVLGRVGAC